MIAFKYIPLVIKQVLRHRARSVLTVAGVAVAMFLFCSVQAMQGGVREATAATAADTTLVVYRENRYCPFTSRLPEYYEQRIARVSGVVSVVPMKIVVNNCRTSLDVVTFRGVPREAFVGHYVKNFGMLEGSVEDWGRRSDSVLLGETLAKRRGLKAGDQFDAAGITVYVAGVVRSDEAQDQNVGYVHLDFLQRNSGEKKLGIVTQFNVKVQDASMLESVGKAIDAEFRNDPEPTHTSAEKAFVARAAADVLGIVRFTKYLGWACLAAVLGLVANAIVLSVQDRIREHAVLATLGFRSSLIARLIVAEALVLGLIGGIVGTLGALIVTRYTQFSLSTEGLSIPISMDGSVIAGGLAVSVMLGVLAGLVPAWQASRREITTAFRAV